MLLREKIPLTSRKLSFLEGILLLLLESRFYLLGKWSLFINSEFHGSNSVVMEEFPMHLEMGTANLEYKEGTWQPTRVPAWKIPWTEEPGGLQSMGSQSGHD